jgi:hypothetical protein
MAVNASALTLEGISQVDTEKRFALGTEITLGNDAYVYVQGVASGAAGAWATFTSAGVTTLLAANAVGRVGIMMAALDATTDYGFVQVKGRNTIAKSDTVAADTVPYIDGTAGRVDDAAVVGDKVYNAVILTADTSNVTTVWINHPYVTNESN